jgi:putative spermidine/putrescine transport system ATP-binding protein
MATEVSKLAGGQADSAVVFQNVGKHYGRDTVLRNFSLSVKAGEFMTLLGPSGSGKTTALNILAGFIAPSSGDVTIGGRSIVGLPPERRNVGMVFQSYSLFPHMSVFNNISFPLRMRRVGRGEIERRVEAVLEMVRLTEFRHRMPKELSGGQRQRVAFARAVVYEPAVLLMDEPLAALDLKLREAMRLEIKRYHSQLGCTIIFVTHDQDEALTLSDRIAVMSDGQIIQVDIPETIYDRPRSPFVATFVGSTNILDVALTEDGALEVAGMRGRVAVPEWDGWAGGRVRQISIRPEKVQIGIVEGTASVSCPEAVVDEVLFLGDLIQYTARLPGGRQLLIQQHRIPGRTSLRRGDRIAIGFSMDDAYPLRR